jgi:hypothetical protein
MNNTVSAVLAFVAGAAIGAAVSWKFAKTKYEMIANEEIESVKEVLLSKRAEKKEESSEDETDEPATRPDPTTVTLMEKDTAKDEYKALTEEYKEKGEPTHGEGPYVISPNDFGEIEEYDTVSLSYFADKILADDDYSIITQTDIEEFVGLESLNHFGEYEDDSVFVRNDRLKIDFEILLDNRNFSDVKQDALRQKHWWDEEK